MVERLKSYVFPKNILICLLCCSVSIIIHSSFKNLYCVFQTEANVDKFGYRTTKTEAEVNAEKVSAQKESPTVEKEDAQNTL